MRKGTIMPHIRAHTRTLSSRGQGRRYLWIRVPVVALLFSSLGRAPSSHAAQFACAAGDVACLVAGIEAANAGTVETLSLAAGTYRFTAPAPDTDGTTALPLLTGRLTLWGRGVDQTILLREPAAPPFRLMVVEPGGELTLHGLTLQGGLVVNDSGAGILNFGSVVLRRSALVGHHGRSTGGL
jgi:hypothetical protein